MSHTSPALTALTEHLPAVQAASAAIMTGIIDTIIVITSHRIIASRGILSLAMLSPAAARGAIRRPPLS